MYKETRIAMNKIQSLKFLNRSYDKHDNMHTGMLHVGEWGLIGYSELMFALKSTHMHTIMSAMRKGTKHGR
jgi:hypothetical protein